MHIVCAWCKKLMGEKAPFENKSSTHTICTACEEKNFPAKLNWKALDFRPLTRTEITFYVMDQEWQKFRGGMSGIELKNKYTTLLSWLIEHGYNRASQVQVTNYINALRRGGLIK